MFSDTKKMSINKKVLLLFLKRDTGLIHEEKNMRLDKYLKVSRLIKRRTVANEACDAGRVVVNGKVARASYDVKVGDEIEIAFGNKTVKARVLKVVETVKKDEAADMFELI